MLYVAVCFIAVSSFVWFQNNAITTSATEIRSENLPTSFDDFKIVHLSDLHNKKFGKNQKTLIRKVMDLEPDIIVHTGDLIDSKRLGDEAALRLMEKLTMEVPVYYVSGNHEWWSGTFDTLEQSLTELGVHVLRNEHVAVERGNDRLYIAGIDDPSHENGSPEYDVAENDLATSVAGMDNRVFRILLTHRPELLPLYAQSKFNLVFAGHAHGGQVRLPFMGGVVAPNQGFLPEYTAGVHDYEQTQMVVSRGLGNSIIPLRLFNRPEIVAVTLKANDE